MRLKKLRIGIAIFAAAAIIPIMTPAEARIFLTQCELDAQEYCIGELGRGRMGDPEFAICYETMRAQFCAPPPPWPCSSPFGCTGPQPW